ncbi:MAG TPA: hypothetical protein VGW40_14980 [Allosphingosinicella sp.]|nr:hypothetical protein [Allosphingosinicella sp.]
MKIGPLPPPAPVARAPAAAEPARPFEEFFDAAYAFTELGMFGHGGGKDAPPGPGTCRGPAVEEPAAAPPATPEILERTIEPAMIPHARALSRHPAPAEVRPIGRSRAATPARAKPLMPAGELPPPEPAPEGPEREAEARTRRTGRRPPTPRSDVSLIVTEKDGRVELVAAAPRLDPETRAALRRLVRDILARSGLSLAYFQLNGAPVATDSLDSTGGSHGTRSR